MIEVSEDRTGRPPPFGGTGGQVHDRIIETMRTYSPRRRFLRILMVSPHVCWKAQGPNFYASISTSIQFAVSVRRTLGRHMDGDRQDYHAGAVAQEFGVHGFGSPWVLGS